MCIRPEHPLTSFRQAGVSLVELILFIVIVSIAVAGILLVMNKVTAHSADAVVHKQSLAIAESLLEEVELMPFTYCDPDDASAVSAASPAGCTTPEGPGPETIGGVTENRYGGANPALVNAYFDNVSDYGGPAWGAAGFAMNATTGGIRDITNNVIAGLNGYAAQVTVTQAALGTVPSTEALQITVTVTGPDGTTVQLDGYRTRYAPNGI